MYKNNHKYQYDFFISYAEDSEAWVKGELLPILRRNRKMVILEDDFEFINTVLENRIKAIENSWRTLVILTPGYFAEPDKDIITLMGFTRSLIGDDKENPIVPVFLKKMEISENVQLLLSTTGSVDLSIKDKELRKQSFNKLLQQQGIQQRSTSDKPVCPYLGMEPFLEKDAHKFFGREKMASGFVDYIEVNTLLVLTGVSGCGKSSLVHAGIIPKLKKDSVEAWHVKTIRPSDIFYNSLSLSSLLSVNQKKDKKTLLVIDQFEEIFTSDFQENKANENTQLSGRALAFVKELSDINKEVKIIITMRDEFYSQLAWCREWLDVDSHLKRVSFIGKQGLVAAIRKPAEKSGVYLDNVLVERLVNDASHDSGILPFVQETMRRLWQRMDNHYIDIEDYESLEGYGVNGLKYAVALKADSAYKSLPSERHRDIARMIFVRLVHFGEGRPNTRRQQTISQLSKMVQPDKYFIETLEHLSGQNNRLLVLGGENKANVDIIHESLIDTWQTLQNWLLQYKKAELIRRSLFTRVGIWVNDFHRTAGFLSKEEVKTIEADSALLEENGLDESIRDYIIESKKEIWRSRLKLFRNIVYGVVLFVIGYFVIDILNSYLTRTSVNKNTESVTIPSISFILGDKNPDITYSKVMWEVENLPVFKIDKYEVDNKSYCSCTRVKTCKEKSIQEACSKKSENPVVNISLAGAQQYCSWLDKRLPLEIEWERVAKGASNRKLPTGESVTKNFYKKLNHALPTQIIDNDDVSEEGVVFLSGNVSEWTLSPSFPYGDNRYFKVWWGSKNFRETSISVRGGNWESSKSGYQSAYRNEYVFNQGQSDIGFRCITSSSDPEEVLDTILKYLHK